MSHIELTLSDLLISQKRCTLILMTTTESTYDDASHKAFLTSGQTIERFHASGECYGDHCPVHNPSDHAFRNFPLGFNMEIFMFTRILPDPVAGVFEIPDPDDYNYGKSKTVIMRNSALCDICKTEVESHYRHDFAQCECGAISVDGGHVYLKRSGTDYIDTSVIFTHSDNPDYGLKTVSTPAIRPMGEAKDTTIIMDSRINE